MQLARAPTATTPLRRAARAPVVAARALDPKKTAVVLIEYQNDFTTENGVLHGAVEAEMKRTNMMANSIETVEKARKAGAMIVHAPIVFSDDYQEISGSFGILSNVKSSGAFKKSGWGGKICEAMTPAPGDVVVEGKRGLCGFASTNLDFILRQRGIENIALGGFLANCCVESTMRSAYERGYNVFTLTDCVAATSEAQSNAAISFTYPMFSKPVTHTEFLSELDP